MEFLCVAKQKDIETLLSHTIKPQHKLQGGGGGRGLREGRGSEGRAKERKLELLKHLAHSLLLHLLYSPLPPRAGVRTYCVAATGPVHYAQ
jgi:hypothetical protein